MKRKMAALVIGNAKYINGGALKNSVNDARDISTKLEAYGFYTLIATDSTNEDMERALKDFQILLESNEVGLFFFAGHGIQVAGHNYLLAVDTKTDDEIAVKHSSLSLDQVIETMETSKAATKIVILDACRDNPWERQWHRGAGVRGLASVYAPKGTIIGFATSPGEVASDGKGRNGTYTAGILQHIDEPDSPIEDMFKRVRNTVAAETRGKQTSWEHTSLSGNFFFNMSLGKLNTTYSKTSLADNLFIVDETKPSHRIIAGLKSHTWPTQNEAMMKLTAVSVKKMLEDNLFVLGRNIYQAACGGSRSAGAFLESFPHKTGAYPVEKRKALLDGMLFEVFFDPDAKLRAEIKANMFDEVFELQKHAFLKDSFDFISEMLVLSSGDFFALPGSGHSLSVTVATAPVKAGYRVDAVFINGVDVLRPIDEESANDDLDRRLYRTKTKSELNEELSRELVVPTRLLKVTFTPVAAAAGPFKMPLGYTVRKH